MVSTERQVCQPNSSTSLCTKRGQAGEMNYDFYEPLREVVRTTKHHNMLHLMGDSNAKVVQKDGTVQPAYKSVRIQGMSAYSVRSLGPDSGICICYEIFIQIRNPFIRNFCF